MCITKGVSRKYIQLGEFIQHFDHVEASYICLAEEFSPTAQDLK